MEAPDAYTCIYEQRRNSVRASKPKPVVVYQFVQPLTIEGSRDTKTYREHDMALVAQ